MDRNHEKQCQAMVDQQIRNRGIADNRVLDAMGRVPRHLFVPDDVVIRSYYDGPLPIGYGQTISQPYIVAYMTELLDLKGDEKILELGTGSGYQTAVLAELTKDVYTVEIIEELLLKSKEILEKDLKYTNIKFRHGNGRDGWPEAAPFDRILLTAAPGKVPESLFDQLAENSILVAPVGNYIQRIIKYTKMGGKVNEQHLISVSFVPFV